MAEIKLDKSRHYGTVHPPLKGAHFSQDGFYFTAHGALVAEMLDDDGRQRLKRALVEKAADEAAINARKKVLLESGMSPDEADQLLFEARERASASIGNNATDEEVDLLGWLGGTKKYVWGKIVSAMKKEFSFTPGSKRAAVDFMVGEGFAKPEDVKISVGEMAD